MFHPHFPHKKYNVNKIIILSAGDNKATNANLVQFDNKRTVLPEKNL